MEDCIAEISEKYPCREEYISQLYRLFGNLTYRYPPAVYLHGPPGAGKTTILQELLTHQNITYAYIDCIEYYTAKLLFETILNKLRKYEITKENNFQNYAECDSIEDFIEELNCLEHDRPYVLILKNHERINAINKNILPVFVRLNQIAMKINISMVLLGCKPLLYAASMRGLTDMICIHCSQYTKDELMEILFLQEDFLRERLKSIFVANNSEKQQERLQIIDSLNDEFFTGYFSTFLNMFYGICRNVRELLCLSNENFPAYCEPVMNGTLQRKEQRKLWNHIEGPFQKAMKSIYCRMESNHKEVECNDAPLDALTAQNIQNDHPNLELPYYTKYLLIAGYLASHNEAKLDRRLFVKNHGKERKTIRSLKAKQKVIIGVK